MSSGYEVVDGGHVGGPLSEWKTIRAVFHNFAELPSERNGCTLSPVLKCHGSEWQIMLYPGGDEYSSADNVFVSLRLHSKSCAFAKTIKAKYQIRVPSAGRAAGSKASVRNFSTLIGLPWGQGRPSERLENYAKREDVLDSSKNYLVDGNLTVEVDIQVMLDIPQLWTPTNTVCPDMLAFLDAADADNTDVTFQTSSDNGEELLYAHGQILAARCPILASLTEDCDTDAPIFIGDVQAGVFRMLLRFVYGGEIPGKDMLNEDARDIIRAADRFGCADLKLTVEAEMATAGITTENAAELILFADGMNCAMLKEAAMEFFVKNAQAVMASDGFEQVKESPAILTELMAAGFGGDKNRIASFGSFGALCSRDYYKRMCVSTLRQKLDDKGLDVDGSKEMLVSRLEEAETEARAQAEALARDQAEALAQAEAEAENGDDDEDTTGADADADAGGEHEGEAPAAGAADDALAAAIAGLQI